jgi:uncharacterized protein (TIGR02265 family)
MRGLEAAELSRFEAPRWEAPYDVEAEILEAPPDATVRGMFFDFIVSRVEMVTGQRFDTTSRIAFGKYPMREYMRLLSRAAEIIHPSVSKREGLRRLGQLVFDDFYETMIGRAIFSVAGRSMERICALAPKAYDVSYGPTQVLTFMRGPKHAQVIHSPMYVFAETFHVGAWEGAARFSGTEAVVRVQKTRPGHFEYDVRWR